MKLEKVIDRNLNKGSIYLQNVSVPLTFEKFSELLEQKRLPKVKDAHYLLHKIYSEFLIHRNNENTYFISIPIIAANNEYNTIAKNRYFKGQGAIFILLTPEDDYIESKHIQYLVSSTSALLKDISYNYLLEVGLGLSAKAKKSSKKAALSQILNRNLSHNHGSHLLANLAEDSPDISDAAEYIQRRQRFDRYLRTRMDYLADISTATPVMASPFYFYRDILLELEKEEVVLKHISGTQLDCTVSESFEYSITQTIEGEQVTERLSDENDLPVSIPNLSLGIHAFYNVVENFIRNTAKHNKITDDVLKKFHDNNRYKRYW